MEGTGMMEYKGGTGSGHYLSWNVRQGWVVCQLLNVSNIWIHFIYIFIIFC